MFELTFINPCPVIWAENPSLKIVLPSTTTTLWIKPKKSHYQGAYLPHPLYYGASGGSSLLPYSIYSSYSPHRLTCPLLSPWSPESSTSLFCKGVRWNGDRNRVDVNPGSEKPPPPTGSTLAVSLFCCYVIIKTVKRDGKSEIIV